MANITHAQFNHFLEAKAPEKACPECGTNRWMAQGMPGPTGEPFIAELFLVADNGAAAVSSMYC